MEINLRMVLLRHLFIGVCLEFTALCFVIEWSAFGADAPAELARKAESLMTSKKYSEALSAYEELIRVCPSCPEAYRGIVTCYSRLGNPGGAVKYMEGLFLEHPERAEVHYGMGVALYTAGQYERAAACFAKAVELNPDLAAAWNNAAVIQHFIKRDFAAARRFYEKAIEVCNRTGNTTVLEIARKNLENLPRPEDLRTMSLEEFVNMFISRAEARDEAGLRHLVISQKKIAEQAMDWLTSAALRAHAAGSSAEEATSADLAKLLAAQYAAVHGSDTLKKKYQEYAELEGERKKSIAQGELMLSRGLDLERQGLAAQAIPLYEQACAFFERGGRKESLGLARLYLGDACRAAHEYRRARDAYGNALTTFIELRDEPRKALALASLGITESLLNNNTEALEFLNRALAIYTSLKDTEAAEKVRRNIELVRSQIRTQSVPGS